MAKNVAALVRQARAARKRAYAPYSNFLVGAAVLTKRGEVFTGCNVENASYGLCNCAERTALFAAIASGCKQGQFTHLAVIGDTPEPISPCGACRQVMLELGGPELVVIRANMQGQTLLSNANELLPGAFQLKKSRAR